MTLVRECISGSHFSSGPLAQGIVMKIKAIFVSVSITARWLLPAEGLLARFSLHYPMSEPMCLSLQHC